MPVPRLIARSLAGVTPDDLPGQIAEAGCEGAKYHSPAPLLVQQVQLGDGSEVVLCGSCRDNLAVLRYLLAQDPDLEWPVRREFGNLIRAIAMREHKATRD